MCRKMGSPINRPEACAAAISGEMDPKIRPRPAEGGVTQPVAGRGGVEKVGGKGIWVAAPAWNDRGRKRGRSGGCADAVEHLPGRHLSNNLAGINNKNSRPLNPPLILDCDNITNIAVHLC
jgi:hypothetical protein